MTLKDRGEIDRYLRHFGRPLKALLRPKTLVADVGCGKGELLKLLSEDYKIEKDCLYGFDRVDNYVKLAKRSLPKLYRWDAELEDYPLKVRFKIVFLFDVIEHVSDLEKFMVNISALIKGGGYLIICTPNRGSLSRLIQGRRWYGYSDTDHKRFFDQNSLSKLLTGHHFEVEASKTISSTGNESYNRIISLTPWGGQILMMAKKI